VPGNLEFFLLPWPLLEVCGQIVSGIPTHGPKISAKKIEDSLKNNIKKRQPQNKIEDDLNKNWRRPQKRKNN
jgi:hypothetical protein